METVETGDGGLSCNFTWQKGRQLSSATLLGNTYTYKYNQDGIRIEKTVGDKTHVYTLNGTRIEREIIKTGNKVVKDIYYYYDASGIISSAKVYVHGDTTTEYGLIFNTNIQGNVEDIYTTDGVRIAKYAYDAWGNITTTYITTNTTLRQLADEAPFRYRGYYYDSETGFYYLNTRYYDPKICRFINADSYVSTGQGLNGNNMFAYCLNNPVMLYDPMGQSGTVIGAAVGAAAVFSVADGPILIGEIIGVVIIAAAILYSALSVEVAGPIVSVENPSMDESKDKTTDVISTDTNDTNQETLIYRYGSILYPQVTDMFLFNPLLLVGVSFSLSPPKNPDQTYYVTTMEKLNESGIFKAVNDRPNHVTVMPTGVYGSVNVWYRDGLFHPYTFALGKLCTRVN